MTQKTTARRRLPQVLLADILLALSLNSLVSGCGSEPPPTAAAAVALPAASPDSPVADRRSQPLLPVAGGPMRSDSGLRLKIVTNQPNLRCLDSPGGRLVGEEIRLFKELWVFDVKPSLTDPKWVKVSRSPQKNHVVGWLPAGTVAFWKTRVGLRPLRPVLIYEHRADAEELARTGKCSAQPIGRADPDAKRQFDPWPVTENFTVKNNQQQIVEVSQLNFLGERRVGHDVGDPGSAAPSYTEARKQIVYRSINQISLGFCVDNTASTAPWVSEILAFVREVSGAVERGKPRLSLGLTLYRDDVPGLEFSGSVTKLFFDGELKDHAAFSTAVSGIKPAEVDSEDFPERGFEGLKRAVTDTDWKKLSLKVLIWIGDNSSKHDRVTAAEVISLAKSSGVTIHAVMIHGRGDPAERQLHESQCREIAAGTGGKLYDLADWRPLAGEIAKAVRGARAIVKANRADLDNILAGRQTVKDFLETKDRDVLERRRSFVRLLKTDGHDLDSLTPNVPLFRQGYVVSHLPGNGDPFFERLIYCERLELVFLMSELQLLAGVLQVNSPTSILDIHKIATLFPAGDQSYFSAVRPGDIPYDVFMACRDIPIIHGITRKTREQLLAMPEPDRIRLRFDIEDRSLPNLKKAKDSDAFVTVGFEDWGWILAGLLP